MPANQGPESTDPAGHPTANPAFEIPIGCLTMNFGALEFKMAGVIESLGATGSFGRLNRREGSGREAHARAAESNRRRGGQRALGKESLGAWLPMRRGKSVGSD